MLTGENSRAVAERVARKIAEIQKRLPPGIVLKPQYNRSELVDRTIRTVETNLFEGAVLVVVVLFALLGNWRAALIVATAIPLSILFAITGMARFGISGNLMSLGAIDFGLIIDGAVVIVENIVRQSRASSSTNSDARSRAEERLHTVLVASQQVGSPMFFGVLIITIVYVPILALTGIEGKMFRPMALTVMLALAGSLVLALTLMPVLCSCCPARQNRGRRQLAHALLQRLYAPMLPSRLRRRWLVVAERWCCSALPCLSSPGWARSSFRTLDEGAFTMMVYRSPSISLDATVEAQTLTDREYPRACP